MARYTDSRIYKVYRSSVLEANEEKGVTRDQLVRLQSLKSQLGKRVPLFDTYINKVPVIFTFDMPTMAVDNFNNLYINPQFFDSLSDDGVIAVLAHEMYHIFYEHPAEGKRRGLDGQLHNFATDYVINRELHKDGMDITRILKNSGDKFNAVTPLYANAKYYIKVGDETIDVTNLSALSIYVALVDEARKQKITLDQLKNEIEKNHGKSGDPQSEESNNYQPAPVNKHVYTVGDIVIDISSKVKGKVVSASEPDSNGDQILDIEWELNETYRYIKETLQKGVSSKGVTLFKPNQPQQQQKNNQQSNQDKQQQSNQDKQQSNQDKQQSNQGEQQQDKQQQSNQGEQTPQQGDVKQDQKRTEKVSWSEKRNDLEKHQRTREQVQRSKKKPGSFNVTGEEYINWGDELKDILIKSVDTTSTIMPDWRSEGIGRYMRGRREVKQKVTVTVMVDTSGSVSKKMYGIFMNEIISIMGQIKGDSELNLILWHTHVYSTSDEFHIDPSDVNKIKNAPFDSGGTEFHSAVDFYDDNKADLDETNIIIVFTDGDFFSSRDKNPNLLDVIPDNVKIVFALFQPSTRNVIDKYKHPNISVIETNIRG